MMTPGQAIRAARLRREWSQRRLAEEAGIGATSIANYESGRFEPSLFSLMCMADALDISIDELVGRVAPEDEDDMY